MKTFEEFPDYGTLLSFKRLEASELIRHSIHSVKDFPDFSKAVVCESSQNQLLRRFQIILAQKLAYNEGNFVIRKIKLPEIN